MSKEYYEAFTNFYNLTVEQATDEDIKYLMLSIRNAAKKCVSNPNLSNDNAVFIRNFFEDFLAKGNDGEAVYLIEGLKALVKNMVDNPKEVAEFIVRKTNEAKKNGKAN